MEQYIPKFVLVAEIKRLIKHSEMVADHNTQITELVSRELDTLYHLISFTNSLEVKEVQEEPVSVWHDASEEPKPNMELICVGQYGNPLVLSSNSDSFKSRDISKWAYFNDLLNLSNAQRTVKDWKEPVSKDLIEAAEQYEKWVLEESYDEVCVEEDGREVPCITMSYKDAFKAGAQWDKQQFITKACKWLFENFRISSFDATKIVTDFSSLYDLRDSFKQAMEE